MKFFELEKLFEQKKTLKIVELELSQDVIWNLWFLTVQQNYSLIWLNAIKWIENCLSNWQRHRRKQEVSEEFSTENIERSKLTLKFHICISELYLGSSLTETFEVPSSIDFVRNHVAKNLPLVIRGALSESAAVKKWNSQHFRSVKIIFFIIKNTRHRSNHVLLDCVTIRHSIILGIYWSNHFVSSYIIN